MLRTIILAALITWLAAAEPARANGRFPASANVVTRPGDADDIYLALTFGMMLSHDDGAHFYWMCEANIGYGGDFDPKYAVGADGTIYATTFEGLRVSYDGGCTFVTATEDQAAGPDVIGPIWVDAIDLGPDGAVWVGTAENGVTNAIFRSTDQAHTFARMGLESTTAWWKSVQVAPSDAQRVYVTGYQVAPTTEVLLYRSIDGGASFQPLPITDIALGGNPLILVEAVDPTNADIVYLRSVAAAGSTKDQLYRSADGGDTWTLVLEATDTLRAFTLRQNGDVITGSVLSDDPERGCTYRSTDRGVTFTACEHGPKMACIDERSDGTLFACGANWDPDLFTLGRSEDATAWTKVVRFHEMSGPLICPTGTAQHDVCELQQWPALREQFQVSGPIDGGPSAAADAGPGGGEGSGCCDASSGGAGTVLLVIGVGLGIACRGRARRSPLKQVERPRCQLGSHGGSTT